MRCSFELRPCWQPRLWLAWALAIALAWSAFPQASLARTGDRNTDSGPAPSTEFSIQPYIDRFAERITEFTLDNGMTFIVMERHQAPVVSFLTYVNVGSAQETEGKTGAAHFLEHLAFKGTRRIGTTDYAAEKPLLDRLDALASQIQAAKSVGSSSEADRLESEFQALQAEAASYIRQNDYGQIVERAGGTGLNATTSTDATRYFYSFPSNKLELWFSLESERFLEPVFREFYEEKDVILEERRLRTDNSPVGKMIEAFLGAAFPGYPYGRPIIGYEQDIRNLSRSDIQSFYDTHYVPSQITAAIVGDVDPEEVKRLAQLYFGRYRARASAPELDVTLPVQTQPQEVTLRLKTQPWYFEGYRRPAISDPDDATYQIIAALLTGGRTSRLFQALVETGMALNVQLANAFPGDRYPSMMMLYALTAPGHTIDEIAAVFRQQLEQLKTEPVTPAELDRVKTQSRAGTLQVLASNRGMASLLPEYQAKTGSWRNLFEELKAFDAVTAADVQRVAQATFVPEKLTIGRLLPE